MISFYCLYIITAARSMKNIDETHHSPMFIQMASRTDDIHEVEINDSHDKSPKNGKKCLRFIHSPRTGGTSVDGMNLHLPKGQRAYESLMEGPIDAAAGGLFFPNLSPGELFDQAHGTELKDESSGAAAEHYGKYIPLLNFHFVSWQHPTDGYTQTCQDLHTPPQYDADVARFFSEPGCTNFCTVRDPMTRLVSAYKFRALGECSTAAFDQWAKTTLPLRKEISFCHAYPQVQYVYNAMTKGAATKQWCQHILRFENLSHDFNQLMEDFGRPLRMTQHMFSSNGCKIDHNNVSLEAKMKIYSYYKADYDAFDYPRPF